MDRSPEIIAEELARWLKNRIPVSAMALWLVDEAKRKVIFMGQYNCPGDKPDPPRIFDFGQFASGRVAENRKHEFFDLDDAASPVHMREKFLEQGIHHLFSVFQDVGKDEEPCVTAVIHFFDESKDRLQRLEEACIRNANVAVRVCLRLIASFANSAANGLTTRLTELPTLAEVGGTLVTYFSQAVECEQVSLYLYHSDLRRLILYKSFPEDLRLLEFYVDDSSRPSYKPGEKLVGLAANLPSALRVADATDEAELARLSPTLEPDFGVDPLVSGALQHDEGINSLCVALREPAPQGFAGFLTGVIEARRRVKKDSGKVYTPLHEYIITELAKAAKPFIPAFERQRSLEPSIKPPMKWLFGELKTDEDITRTLSHAEEEFRNEIRVLLNSWRESLNFTRSFFAFRTLRNRCKPVWITPDAQPGFEDSERSARRELQQAILASGEPLLKNKLAVSIESEFLAALNISSDYHEILSPLGFVLVPLFSRDHLTGILGLEFESTDQAKSAIRRIQDKREETVTRFIRNSLIRVWFDHQDYLRRVFSIFLEEFSKEIASEVWNRTPQEFFNFFATGKADRLPNEASYDELMARLKTLPSDARCKLTEECDLWQDFARKGEMAVPIEPIELNAKPATVRIVLATSTVSVLWGSKAKLSWGGETLPGWCQLLIEVPPNGHETIRRKGLAFAKAISEYRGWKCEALPNGIAIQLPNYEAALPNI